MDVVFNVSVYERGTGIDGTNKYTKPTVGIAQIMMNTMRLDGFLLIPTSLWAERPQLAFTLSSLPTTSPNLSRNTREILGDNECRSCNSNFSWYDLQD
jgi:hypothetical protein